MEKPITVQSYSGYKGDERPVSFQLGERALQVREIIDRWYDIGHHYFRVLADDGKPYLLRRTMDTDQWELVEAKAGRVTHKD